MQASSKLFILQLDLSFHGLHLWTAIYSVVLLVLSTLCFMIIISDAPCVKRSMLNRWVLGVYGFK